MSPEAPGGGFLLGLSPEVPSPELDPEARGLGQGARDFVRRAVLPQNAALEGGDLERLRALLREAGSAGLLGVEIPSRFGGLEAAPATANAVLSGLGHQAGFAVSCAAHLTIGTVPLLRHASDALRGELLPAVASGERIGAYALTEPGSGSDALNLSTRAEPAPSGFRLTGAKAFITNAGIADHLLVFARVEGSGPTAFLVQAGARGLELGAEERKLGLHASSTRAVFLDGVEVPAGRVVGEVGQGHRVALDALTVGRHKLGALAAGHLELLLEVGARYAAERRQFGKPIGELGLVAELLGESIALACALEAVVARAAPLTSPAEPQLQLALVEAALCKVSGSEALCEVADAMLQLHGGIGYVRGAWVEQSYRDARANRIYEGTDEINRRAIASGLLRSVRRGRLSLEDAAAEAMRALSDGPSAQDAAGLALHARRLALVGLSAGSRLPEGRDELEGALADLALAAYASDSAARWARRASERGELHAAAATLAASRAVERAHRAYGALAALAGGLPTRGLSLLDVMPSLDRGALRRELARAALDAGRNPLARFDAIRPPPCG